MKTLFLGAPLLFFTLTLPSLAVGSLGVSFPDEYVAQANFIAVGSFAMDGPRVMLAVESVLKGPRNGSRTLALAELPPLPRATGMSMNLTFRIANLPADYPAIGFGERIVFVGDYDPTNNAVVARYGNLSVWPIFNGPTIAGYSTYDAIPGPDKRLDVDATVEWIKRELANPTRRSVSSRSRGSAVPASATNPAPAVVARVQPSEVVPSVPPATIPILPPKPAPIAVEPSVPAPAVSKPNSSRLWIIAMLALLAAGAAAFKLRRK